MEKILTTSNLVHDVLEQLKKTDFWQILDYANLDKNEENILDIEFDVLATTKYGGNEGIYTDLWINGNIGNSQNNSYHICTCKTLYEDDEHFRQMALFGAEFQILSRKWIDQHFDQLIRTGVKLTCYKNEIEKAEYICCSKERAEEKLNILMKYGNYDKAVFFDMFLQEILEEKSL